MNPKAQMWIERARDCRYTKNRGWYQFCLRRARHHLTNP